VFSKIDKSSFNCSIDISGNCWVVSMKNCWTDLYTALLSLKLDF
jgi:hypothetical protein